MTTYARIVGNLAVDVITADPATLYHPEIAAEFKTVPDTVEPGDIFDGSAWAKRTERIEQALAADQK